ncbi:hypothetical protein [Vibrio sp. D431a]|uniref:hypothetical protein n=1 Tax=Vibrio sp. D431a TaxID=2837388 RepID=UPI00255700AF|nr:hypothetical protein [Vibrio sp. D431a]MDK9789867.1 hypothetical protein [Vibrio sp. D431a]
MLESIKVNEVHLTISQIYEFYKEGHFILHGKDDEVSDMTFAFDHSICGITLPNFHAITSVGEDGKYKYDVFKGASYLSSMFEFMDNKSKTSSVFLPDASEMTYQQLPSVISKRFSNGGVRICAYDKYNCEKDALLKVIAMLSPNCLESLSVNL